MGTMNGGSARAYPQAFRAGDVESARDVARRNRQLGNIRAVWPLRVESRDGSLVFSLCGTLGIDTWEAFGYKLQTGNLLKVRSRMIYIHQIAEVLIEESTVHLTGATAEVYIRMDRQSYYWGQTIHVATTAPTSDASFLFIVLFRFALDTGTNTYYRTGTHTHDINIDSPAR